MDLSLYVCVCICIYITINRVVPPFAARPNLGSRSSCQPWALNNKIKNTRLYRNMDLSLYICVCICIYITINRVAPPFAARPNLGSQTSCRPLKK